MRPTWDQIQREAYARWERRGYGHGGDRDDWLAAEIDLTFDLNFETVAEVAEGESQLSPRPARPRCRFCEQSAPRARFQSDRPLLPPFLASASPPAGDLCDECAEQFEASIDRELKQFWEAFQPPHSTNGSNGTHPLSPSLPVGAYKGLIRIALMLLPEQELAAFTDTIEWIGNPDHEFDRRLFGGAGCLAYQLPWPRSLTRATLARRTDDDAPYPYMLFFLMADRLVLQTYLPLCSHDEDLDGRDVEMPRRTFSEGFGSSPVECTLLPVQATTRPRTRRWRLFA